MLRRFIGFTVSFAVVALVAALWITILTSPGHHGHHGHTALITHPHIAAPPTPEVQQSAAPTECRFLTSTNIQRATGAQLPLAIVTPTTCVFASTRLTVSVTLVAEGPSAAQKFTRYLAVAKENVSNTAGLRFVSPPSIGGVVTYEQVIPAFQVYDGIVTPTQRGGGFVVRRGGKAYFFLLNVMGQAGPRQFASLVGASIGNLPS